MPDDQDDAQPGPGPTVRPAERNEAVLPDISSDELDVGWGDETSERDDEWYQRERPPHHE
jgi:hypothetical protein